MQEDKPIYYIIKLRKENEVLICYLLNNYQKFKNKLYDLNYDFDISVHENENYAIIDDLYEFRNKAFLNGQSINFDNFEITCKKSNGETIKTNLIENWFNYHKKFNTDITIFTYDEYKKMIDIIEYNIFSSILGINNDEIFEMIKRLSIETL